MDTKDKKKIGLNRYSIINNIQPNNCPQKKYYFLSDDNSVDVAPLMEFTFDSESSQSGFA